MKTLHLSIMILSFVLLSVMLSQNVAATVPLVEIMLSGTANNQNCENKCVISQTVTIQKGSAVEWINNDLIPHTLVSGKPDDKNNNTLFDSGQIWVGKFFIYNFNNVGVYNYFEKDHPENTGIINVTDETYTQSISEVTPLQTHDNNGSNLTIHNETGVDVSGKILPPPALPSEPLVAITSPLKQFKSGIAVNDVKCEQGLQLVIRAEDGSPACVKPDTAYILIFKGWAKEFIQSIRATSSDLCGGIEVPSGNLRTGMVPVLMMKPNSTATVCVTYQFLSDWNSYPNKNFYPHGIFETCCLVHMGKSSTTTLSNQFEVLADPPLFNVTGVYNESKTTVVYKIHAGLDSRGFYDTSIPYGNCNSYPLAVGYDSSQVDASDFSYNMDIPCYNTIDKVDSVKIVSGMSYKEVAFR